MLTGTNRDTPYGIVASAEAEPVARLEAIVPIAAFPPTRIAARRVSDPHSRPRCDTRSLARQAVLFDLDGTLVDLRAVYVRAHRLAAREVLALELDESHVLELMAIGSPIRTHMAHLDEAAADLLVEVFVARYREEREGLARPFPGVRRLLQHLRNRGVPVAVVTSKLREDALTELAATGLDRWIELVIAFEDTDEHKPAAAPQLAALRSLGVDEGIGVGDLPSDIKSARAGGLRALAVAWGYGNLAALRAAGAECVCDTPAALTKALEERLGQPPRPSTGVAAGATASRSESGTRPGRGDIRDRTSDQ